LGDLWFPLNFKLRVEWGILLGRLYIEYYQQRYQDSSTEDVTVKEDNSQKLIRFQDLVWLKCIIIAGYDWKYLIEERNCELAAFFGVFIYRFPFFNSTFSYYFYIGFSFFRDFDLV
jgi:hypothetical protein